MSEAFACDRCDRVIDRRPSLRLLGVRGAPGRRWEFCMVCTDRFEEFLGGE